jgi:hypothetical protein
MVVPPSQGRPLAARKNECARVTDRSPSSRQTMKLVPTFVVVVFNAPNGCTEYLHAKGKRRARWEHAQKFISREAAEEFVVKPNGRVLEYAARAVEE